MKRIASIVVALILGFAGMTAQAQNVEVRFLKGKPFGKADLPSAENVITKKYRLKKTEDGLRLTIPKEDISADIWGVEVVPTFMTAKKGDEGYWMNGRGVYGLYDKEEGSFYKQRSVTPVYAMKKGDVIWYGHVKKWRFDYNYIVRAVAGKYESVLRFRADRVRAYFDLYDDIVVDYNSIKGENADYNGVAKAYREYQMANNGVRTIKDRAKDFPQLNYLAESFTIRIQTHASKHIATEIPKEQADFTPETEYPLEVHMPFGVAEEFMQAIKDAGVDKATFVSAGWNYGGYDGRTPQHFPVEPSIGGEEGLRRMIERAKKLDYQITLHATNTDGYTVSPMWDPAWAGKLKNGKYDRGMVWAGGWNINVCQVASWNGWVQEEMVKMADLGTVGPHYIDVYSATYPNICADPNHPATPEIMALYQNKILTRAKELMGGAASEGAYDHVAANIDYINYVERDLKNLWEGNTPFVTDVFPFWELVYHGIIFYNPDRATQNHTRGKCLYKLEKSGDPRWMEGDGIVDPKVSLKIVEFGARPIFYTYKFADVPRIKRAWDEYVPVRHLQKELMTDHECLMENVYMTTFEDGSRIICNYNDAVIEWSGNKVQPISYILINPDGSVYVPKAF